MEHRIEIWPVSVGTTGQRYAASWCGELIVSSSKAVEHDACRVLRAKGLRGTLVTYSAKSEVPRMRMSILRGAGRTVTEGAKQGPRQVKWYPHHLSDTRH